MHLVTPAPAFSRHGRDSMAAESCALIAPRAKMRIGPARRPDGSHRMGALSVHRRRNAPAAACIGAACGASPAWSLSTAGLLCGGGLFARK